MLQYFSPSAEVRSLDYYFKIVFPISFMITSGLDSISLFTRMRSDVPATFMKSFISNCTLPPGSPNYVGTVTIRSTLEIVWSCLSIILLCTWTIQHLNVPQQIVSQTFGERFRRSLLRVWQKSKWMLLTIFAPELITGKAFAELISARSALRPIRLFQEVKEGNAAWTMAHCLFANMGGIELHFPPGTPLPPGADERTRYGPDTKKTSDGKAFLAAVAERCTVVPWSAGSVPWMEDATNARTVLHAFDLVTEKTFKNSYLMSQWKENAGTLQGSIWALNTRQLRVARDCGIIEWVPDISKESLQDRSKSDGLIKCLSIVQILWLMIQLTGSEDTQASIVPTRGCYYGLRCLLGHHVGTLFRQAARCRCALCG